MTEHKPSLMIVDDDDAFCTALAKSLGKRGFIVSVAHSASHAITKAEIEPIDYAVLDLNMPGPSGLTIIKKLTDLNPSIRIVVLTGYASIATAVEAIKLGATHYLSKPVDADEIVAAFDKADGDVSAPIQKLTYSTRRVEWEHIQQVLVQHEGNISATARSLKMHRRTLQRKLFKRPAKI